MDHGIAQEVDRSLLIDTLEKKAEKFIDNKRSELALSFYDNLKKGSDQQDILDSVEILMAEKFALNHARDIIDDILEDF